MIQRLKKQWMVIKLQTSIDNLVLKGEVLPKKPKKPESGKLPATGITPNNGVKQISLLLIACGIGLRMINKKRKMNR